MVENFEFSGGQEQRVLCETAKTLNNKFSSGKSVWKEDVLREIRSLARPIVVDFNGVLVNQGRPWFPNPKAIDFLEQLNKLGTVIILTSAYGDWGLRRQSLQKFGLWYEGMVLLTVNNWHSGFINAEENDQKQRLQEIENFSKLKNLSSTEWALNENGKRIGHIFMKHFDVPIIDDEEFRTLNNPGMLGITVQSFGVNKVGRDISCRKKGASLESALEIVGKHYACEA